MARNETSTLNLQIKATDKASEVFLNFAKQVNEAFKLATVDAETFSKVYSSLSEASSVSSTNTTDNTKKITEAMYATREELLSFARTYPEIFNDPKAAMKGFADVSTSDLARVVGGFLDCKIKVLDDLTQMTDVTDNKGVKSANRFRETWVLTADEISAEFKNILASEKDYAQFQPFDGNLKVMKDVVDGYHSIRSVILDTKDAEVQLDDGTKRLDDTLLALQRTSVMTTDQLKQEFQRLTEFQQLSHLKPLADAGDTAGMRAVVEQLDQIKIKLVDVQQEEETVDKQTLTFSRNMEKLMGTSVLSVEQLRGEFDRLTQTGSKLEHLAPLSGSESQMKKVVEQVHGINVELEHTETQSKNTGTALDSMAKLGSLQMVSSSTENLGRSVVGFFTGATTSALHFQQQVDATAVTLESHLKDGLKLTQDQYQALNDKMLDLGKNGMFSAEQLSEATYTLARQGINYEDIMGGAINSVHDLAVATDSDLNSTANVVSDIIHEMGGELTQEFGKELPDQFNGVANMISGSMHNARMSMDDFMNTLKYVGPQAGGLGMSLQDVSTSIALLAEHGIKGSQAGTTLRRTLSALVPDTDAAKNKFKEWNLLTADGLSVFQKEDGTLKGLSEVQKILHERLGNLSEAQQQQALKSIFGMYALSGLTVMTNATAKDMGDLTQEVTKNSNAHDLAAAKWDNSAGAVRKMQAGWETLKKEIGEQIIPVLNKLITIGQGVMDWFNSLSPGMKEFLVNTTLVTGVTSLFLGKLGNLVANLGFLKNGLADVVKWIAPLATGGGEVATAVEAVGSTAVATTGGIGALGTAFALLTNPITLSALAIAGIGVALYNLDPAFKKTMDNFKEWFVAKDPMEKIKESSNSAVTSTVEMSNKVETELALLRTNGGKITDETYDNIVKSADTAYTQVTKTADDRYTQELADITKLKQGATSVNGQMYTDMEKKAKENHDTQTAEAKSTHEEVLAEVKKLKDAGVNVTDDMVVSMEKKWANFRDVSVAILSDNKDQATTVLNKLKTDGGKITDEIASNAIKQEIKVHDDTVAKANETYKDKIATITRLRNEGVITSDEQAQGMMDAAKRERDGVVDQADKMKTETVDKIVAMMEDGGKGVDRNTAKILSPFEQVTNSIKDMFTSVGDWWYSHVIKPIEDQSADDAFRRTHPGMHYDAEAGSYVDDQTGAPVGRNADGTDFWRGGLTWVGERGPELINLPRGAQVIPNHKLSDYSSGVQMGSVSSSKQQVTNINVTVNGAGRNGQQIGDDIARQIRLQMPVVF